MTNRIHIIANRIVKDFALSGKYEEEKREANMDSAQEYIAVDLDGTLAEYHEFKGINHIGDPIPKMIKRVKKWLADGEQVRIFTARVDGGEAALSVGNEKGEQFRDVERVKIVIRAWCKKHIGQELPITNIKDYLMKELWDDRAIGVIPNTGERVDGRA